MTGWDRLLVEWGPAGRPLPSQAAAQLVGGPRDGEVIAIRDRVIRFLSPPPEIRYVPEDGPIPVEALEPRTVEYVLKKWRLCFDAAPVRLFVCEGVDLEAQQRR